jgi:hypothetical protein
VKPLTPAQRQKRHRDTGRSITVVLTCPVAIAALESIQRIVGGSTKAAIESALRAARLDADDGPPITVRILPPPG